MPRPGGRSHNTYDLYPDTDHHILHGTRNEPIGYRVARADKTAERPVHEHGAGLEGMSASGGYSQGLAQGPFRGQGGRARKN
ncbi:uncharacterized protein F4812DRAFT_445670 [Daldinia caldariorum]|uniref:uncharacterized protein n=1 Tax=Daldinia caldariorum TaxID=326644 RepID=UPI0020082465|nr:uncharacterized protein F4812DRAFT_445670 [Daldinia caldariorum]KAI1463841.1 hypothetical protein F4812DRAFT_445670 [Daldinia caldariorum]